MKKTTVTETDRRKDGRTYGLGDGYGDDDDGGSGGGECDEDHDGRVLVLDVCLTIHLRDDVRVKM